MILEGLLKASVSAIYPSLARMVSELCATMAFSLYLCRKSPNSKSYCCPFPLPSGTCRKLPKRCVHLPDFWNPREINFNSLFGHSGICLTKQENGPGFLTVPAGPSRLLKIGFRVYPEDPHASQNAHQAYRSPCQMHWWPPSP